ncbi:MAG: rhodanese-like domain-containing protein [Chloroflexota bacterium]
MTEAARVGHKEVQKLIEQGAQILDALPADDYAKQHIAGAINVPLEKFSQDLIRDLDPNKPTITYCFDNQCDLSARLAARLVTEKFSQVYEYAASLADWVAYGLPIEGEEADIPRNCDVARREFPMCGQNETASDVLEKLGEHTICAVVDDEGVLLGRLLRKDLEAKPGATAAELLHPGPSTFRPDVPVKDMAKWFGKRKVDAFIVTTPDGRPFGVLYRDDVEAALGETPELTGSKALSA